MAEAAEEDVPEDTIATGAATAAFMTSSEMSAKSFRKVSSPQYIRDETDELFRHNLSIRLDISKISSTYLIR